VEDLSRNPNLKVQPGFFAFPIEMALSLPFPGMEWQQKKRRIEKKINYLSFDA